MSGHELTPPGPLPEPTSAYAGPDAFVPPVAASFNYFAPVHRPGGLTIASLLLAGGVAVLHVFMALAVAVVENGDGVNSFVFGVLGYGLLATVSLLLMLAAYIVTCIWLMQCREFAAVYRPGDPYRRGTAWLWLGWWVPIASFFVPCQVVRDSYRASRPWLADTGLVSLWWFLWLVYNVVSFGGSDSGELLPSATSEIVTAALSVAAFTCWAVIIRRIDQGQNDQELA